MKEEILYCGTKKELLEYFYNKTKFAEYILKNKESINLLYSKEGIEKQINELLEKNKDMGLIYYMEGDKLEDDSEVTLSLKCSHIHIKNDIIT
jgi:hypothetical protein